MIIQMIIQMLFSFMRLHQIQNIEQTEKKIQKTERQKPDFPKQ